MSAPWDVLVAGAGPAGSRAAELLARRGARVVLLDPKAPWEKPCGGGLTAAALAHTPDLQTLAGQWQLVHEMFLATPRGATVTVPLRRPFAVLSRETLARWGLERATAAGARLVSRAVRSAERDGEGWRVTDGHGETYRARWLVGADGAASTLRPRLAPRLRPALEPTRVAYPTTGAPPGVAAVLLFPRCGGYLWDFPRPGHHSVGIGVSPGVFARGVLDWAITEYGTGDEAAVRYQGAAIATTAWLSGRFRDLGSREYALLGDAAGLADPVTGEGIDYAFRSAALAAETFDERRGFAGYPAAARRAFMPEIRRSRMVQYLIYRPTVIEWLIRGARRWPAAATATMALADVINEHLPLTHIPWRALLPDGRDRARAEQLVANGCVLTAAPAASPGGP
jgi:geranylgeranyl diphosphate/geranylgeranyl-bacteriochlorophyllide a reductase